MYIKLEVIKQETRKWRDKNEIGKIAVSLSENNKVIFFDTSTTVAALCQYVEGNIEAYTHSLDKYWNIIESLFMSDDWWNLL
mgnify:CR=1 FL=1